MLVFFFKQKTAYEMRISDWSSDVCSSDLGPTKQDGAGVAWWITVVVTASPHYAHVAITGRMREPAQERQAEMRFNQAPAVGCSKVHNTLRWQNTSHFVQMLPFPVSISPLFAAMFAAPIGGAPCRARMR